jgi:hypothetical protein
MQFLLSQAPPKSRLSWRKELTQPHHALLRIPAQR